jgi:hypothetical protein
VQVQEGLVVATEVVGLAAPPPASAPDSLGEQQRVAEMANSQAVSEPQVRTAS